MRFPKMFFAWAMVATTPALGLLMYRLGRSTESMVLFFMWVLAVLILIDEGEVRERGWK